jgi:hypothetical protein
MACALSIVRILIVPPAMHRRHGVTSQHLYESEAIVRLNEQRYDRTERDRAHLDPNDDRCIAIQ